MDGATYEFERHIPINPLIAWTFLCCWNFQWCDFWNLAFKGEQRTQNSDSVSVPYNDILMGLRLLFTFCPKYMYSLFFELFYSNIFIFELFIFELLPRYHCGRAFHGNVSQMRPKSSPNISTSSVAAQNWYHNLFPSIHRMRHKLFTSHDYSIIWNFESYDLPTA